MNQRSHVITRKQVDPPYMLLRAPKYIHQLGRAEFSGRYLRAFKAAKVLTCIPKVQGPEIYHIYDYESPEQDKRTAPIQQVILKHSKTCKKGGYKMSYFNDQYKGYTFKHRDRIYRRQIAWDKFTFSIFHKNLFFNYFLTKSCVQNLFIYCELQSHSAKREDLDYDISCLARHLPVLKGLELLTIQISTDGIEEKTFKFLKLLNHAFAFMGTRTKLCLVIPPDSELKNSSLWFEKLAWFPNIFQRITHLDVSFYSLTDEDLESLVTMITPFTNLMCFELEIQYMKYFKNDVMEKLFDVLTANYNLRKLRVSISKWGLQTIATVNTLELARYKGLLTRLTECEISVPFLSFESFDHESDSNHHIPAQKIKLVGTVIDGEGFYCFLSMLRTHTIRNSHLSLDIRNSEEEDMRSAVEMLARDLGFEKVDLTIKSLSCLDYPSDGLSQLLMNLNGPQHLELINGEGEYWPCFYVCEAIFASLEASSRTLKSFKISPRSRCIVNQVEGVYKMSSCNSKHGMQPQTYSEFMASQDDKRDNVKSEQIRVDHYIRRRPLKEKEEGLY